MESSWIRDWTLVSYVGRWILDHWATRKALVFFFYLTLVQYRGNQGRGDANSINNNPHLSMFQSTCNLYVIPLNSPPSAWALLLITFYETDSEVLNDVPKVTWLQKVCMYTHTYTHTHRGCVSGKLQTFLYINLGSSGSHSRQISAQQGRVFWQSSLGMASQVLCLQGIVATEAGKDLSQED